MLSLRQFYTSDMHFNHENILRLCKRPFDNVMDMNNYIISAWNSVVTNNDMVYIVGDVAYRTDIESTVKILKGLKGKKVLIVGNHDKKNLKSADFRQCFMDIKDILTIYDDSVQEKVVLCHYPMVEWDGYFRGTYHVYGHIHSAVGNAFKCMSQLDKALNAGVDVNYFRPVIMPELIINNQRFKEDNRSC